MAAVVRACSSTAIASSMLFAPLPSAASTTNRGSSCSPAGFSGRGAAPRAARLLRCRAIAVPRPSRTAEEEHARSSARNERELLQSRPVSSPRSPPPLPTTSDNAASALFDDDDDVEEFGTSSSDHRGLLLSQIADSGALCHYSQGVDLVLSSGFLAFANHAGFLQAVDDAGLRGPVRGIMGTSAGALAGSLYAAGLSPAQLARELRRVAPVRYLRPSLRPWRGLASLDGVVERLRDLLPATFEELEMEFAVGVVDASTGRHVVVDSGPLPEAVAASAAIPCVFAPLSIPGAAGGPFADGGVVDRTGLSAWRESRRARRRAGGGERQQQRRAAALRERAPSSEAPVSSSSSASQQQLEQQEHPAALVHLIHRSSQLSGNDDLPEGRGDVLVVRSPRAGVSFFSLGDFDGQRDAARERAAPVAAAAAAAAEAAAKAEACAASAKAEA